MTGPGRAPIQLHNATAPLLLLGGLAVFGIVMTLVWFAAALAGGAAAPPWGGGVLRALILSSSDGDLTPLIGRYGSRPVFWVVIVLLAAALLAAITAVTIWVSSRWGGFGTAAGSLARRADYRDMHGKGARDRAIQLRPSLDTSNGNRNRPAVVHERDLGLRLGRLGSTDLYASEEDVLLEIAGPRSNKTSAVVVPAVLSAPGPVITTSNKVDVYTLTVGLRSQVGRVFVLDPQAIAGTEQSWWWNPLDGIRDMADAQYLVTHFSQTVGAGNERADPYFTRGAERLLGQLIVAAARSERSLRDVRLWLATRSEDPVGLLREQGLSDIADGLQGTIEAPSDQRGGLYETALTAISCLESEPVARYVTPPATWLEPPRTERVEQFDPWRFIVGYDHDDHGSPVPRDTLYLLTREGAGTGAPIVAAIVDHLLRVTANAATARGGRVDPPVRAVLDEAANICPIRNLPDLYSYFGSMSIQVTTFLQSYQQGVAIWGRAGMDKLWSAATVKLIGAGVHDPEFCEHVSRLIGEHDVPTWTSQSGRGGSSTSMSTRRDRILSAADVAALPKTSAVLISSGRKPGLITLLPWYTERDSTSNGGYGADTITAHAAQASEQVRDAAIAALGHANPLARLLLEERAAEEAERIHAEKVHRGTFR